MRSLFLRGWHPFFWVGLIAFFLYLKAVTFKLVFFDDSVIILDNYWFLIKPGSIFKCFTEGVFFVKDDIYYRPLLMLSFILDAQIGGRSPAVYHLTNILIHSCCSILVCVLLLKLSYGRLKAFLLSLLFAVHPVLSQAVAWIPGRNDSLLALFIIPSLIFLMDFQKAGRMRDLFAHILFLTLALFTKETAVVLIPAGILYCWIAADHRPLKRLWLMIPIWLFPVCLYLLMKSLSGIPGFTGSLSELKDSFAVFLPSMAMYLGKLIFPVNLSGTPTVSSSTLFYGYAALALAAAALLLTPRERLKYSFFGIVWFFIFLVPTFLFTIDVSLEHRLYVPMIGFLIIAAEVDWRRFCPDKRLVTAASVLVIILFGALAFAHSDIFISRLIFWESAVRSSGNSWFAHTFLGRQYMDYGKNELAERHLNKAIELGPNHPQPRIFYGVLLLNRGDINAAERELLAADKLKTEYASTYFNFGVLCGIKGKYEKAIWFWERSIEFDRDFISGYSALASYYQMMGNIKKRDYYAGIIKERFGFSVNYSTESFSAKG